MSLSTEQKKELSKLEKEKVIELVDSARESRDNAMKEVKEAKAEAAALKKRLAAAEAKAVKNAVADATPEAGPAPEVVDTVRSTIDTLGPLLERIGIDANNVSKESIIKALTQVGVRTMDSLEAQAQARMKAGIAPISEDESVIGRMAYLQIVFGNDAKDYKEYVKDAKKKKKLLVPEAHKSLCRTVGVLARGDKSFFARFADWLETVPGFGSVFRAAVVVGGTYGTYRFITDVLFPLILK